MDVWDRTKTQREAAIQKTDFMNWSDFFFIFTIADNDECSEGSHTCDGTANCINTNGSFKCECKKNGFSWIGQACIGICMKFSKSINLFSDYNFNKIHSLN